MLTLSLLLLACGSSPDDALVAADDALADESDLTVAMAAPDHGYQLVTDSFEVPAYTELEMCSILRLDPDAEETLAWVNRMESLSSPGTHHMNVVIGQFSFLDGFLGEGSSEEALGAKLGQVPCSELPTMELGFPIFPSQRENQEITMPAGVAAPLPLPLVAVFSHHYVNTGAEPLSVNAVLNLTTVPADEVETVASLLFDDIGDLEVPPLTRRTEARTCMVERDVEVALVSTHNHEWGACATLNRYDGATGEVAEEPFYVNKSWDQPPILHFEPETFSLAAGDGVHWACHYENDTDRTLDNDGTAAGEMCVFAAVTWPSPFGVEEVEQIVADKDLTALLGLMNEVLGPCDRVDSEILGPWPLQDEGLGEGQTCEGYAQTESNTLD